MLIHTLPHLDKEDRKEFLNLLDKENERVYEYNNKRSKGRFFIQILLLILFAGIVVLFAVFDKDDLLMELIKMGSLLLGGVGITTIYFKK